MLRGIRLRNSLDFRRVYGARTGRGGRYMVLHAIANDLGHPRVGFSVSTRVGGSVTRNLLKRRLRAAAIDLLRSEKVGVDLVVSLRPGAVGASFSDLALELAALYREQGRPRVRQLNTGAGGEGAPGATLG
ncbi:MAG: ribonuclease P protein component [Candidatus Dormibacteria bacterium]